jgi:hypothetical protein
MAPVGAIYQLLRTFPETVRNYLQRFSLELLVSTKSAVRGHFSFRVDIVEAFQGKFSAGRSAAPVPALLPHLSLAFRPAGLPRSCAFPTGARPAHADRLGPSGQMPLRLRGDHPEAAR